MTPSQERRARILAAFARRALFAARAQQERLEQAELPADHDLDFYAHAAWQLREAGRQAANRLGLPQLKAAIAGLDEAMPGLRDYRDMITHSLDDRIARPAWFGSFAVDLQDGGVVRYLVDTRNTQHAALETFGRVLLDELSDYTGEDLRMPA